MKLISILVIMLSISSLANAGTSASASISNLHFETLGGPSPTDNIDSIFISSRASNNGLSDYHSASQPIFNITSSTQNNYGYAETYIKNSLLDAELSSVVNSNLGYAETDTYEAFTINYVANTTLNITASAFITGSSSSQDSYSSTFANLSLRNQSLTYYKESSLQQYIISNSSYALGKVLSISYSSNIDQLLYFNAEVVSTAYSETMTSQIPEPDTYLSMSLGLLSLFIKLKRS